MGVLDSILAYKAQKDAQARADIDAIPQGIAAFTAAKQVAQKSQLDMLTNQISAAKSGFDIIQEGGSYKLKQNPDYQNVGGGSILQVSNTGEVETVGSFKKGDKVVRQALTPDEIKERTQAQREVITDNPQLTDDTRGAIAAADYVKPRIESISKILDSDAFGEGAEKLFKQVTVSKEGELIIPDGSPLEEMIGHINDIKLTGFGLGGKNFTENEAKIIFGRLNPTGKSKERYKRDLSSLNEFFERKASVGTSGLSDAREKTSSYSNNSSSVSSKSSGGNEILVDPNGVRRTVSADKVEAALKAGFKRGK